MKIKALLGIGMVGLMNAALNLHAQTVDSVITNLLFEPHSIVLSSENNYIITDSANNRIVRWIPDNGQMTTLAGVPGEIGSNDGRGVLAHFFSPQGIVDAPDRGGFVVADSGNHTLRLITETGDVSLLAGAAGEPGFVNDPGNPLQARFRFPIGLAIDGDGNIYIADSKNSAIRRLGTDNSVTTVADAADGLNQPAAVTVGEGGQVFLADTRNHSIKVIEPDGTVNLVAGSGSGLVSGAKDSLFGETALFSNPRGLLWLGPTSGLLVSDSGNHTLRRVYTNTTVNAYSVETFAGIPGESGFENGTALEAKLNSPVGLALDRTSGGFIFVDLANNAVRRIQTSPPLPPVSNPRIGWVDFQKDAFGELVSILRPVSQAVFNNEVIIAILAEAATETFFTFGPTPDNPLEDVIPVPTRVNGATPPAYEDGLPVGDVPPSMIVPRGDVTIKAIGTQDGRRPSEIIRSRFQFRTANPVIQGDNPASFELNNLTLDAEMWYSVDGSDPTNTPPSLGPASNGDRLSLRIGEDDLEFKVRAFRTGFRPSDTITKVFSPTNFIPNQISFGFAAGEGSSAFVGSAGQRFYAPVTLSLLPSDALYSLQFNVGVTNLIGPAVAPGAVGFQSMLEGLIPNTSPPQFFVISNWMFIQTNIFVDDLGLEGQVLEFRDLLFTNTEQNLLGVGWLERFGKRNLFDTTRQTLTTYSQAHDTLFLGENGKVITGGYSFVIPTNAVAGNTFEIQIDRPSATSDGVSADVFIDTPTNGALGAGPINATKHVTVGQLQYVVGDVAPFRWFNAGDFGDTNLLNNDVLQVFQSAIYALNTPPAGSDFFDAMDSADGFPAEWFGLDIQNVATVDAIAPMGAAVVTVANVAGTLHFRIVDLDGRMALDMSEDDVQPEKAIDLADLQDRLTPFPADVMDLTEVQVRDIQDRVAALFDYELDFSGGNDRRINDLTLGDGLLGVNDIYVTFRRALDPTLMWYARFWSNGVRHAVAVPNRFRPANELPPSRSNRVQANMPAGGGTSFSAPRRVPPAVEFSAADVLAEPGAVISVPIHAAVSGGAPLRVMMLNLNVVPLDGAPPLTDPVEFAPAQSLGVPTFTFSTGPANYAGAWLNPSVSGLTNEGLVGALSVRVPDDASDASVYRIEFEHASGSADGLGLFRSRVREGLVMMREHLDSSLHDEIPDSWRLRHFGSLKNVLSWGSADADGDGLTNREEFLAGTLPNDVESLLRLRSHRRRSGEAGDGGGLILRWPTVKGKRYQIECAPSLSSDSWTVISDTIDGSGGEEVFTDTQDGTGPRFYRVRVAD